MLFILILFTLMRTAFLQTLQTVSNDADFSAAINNTKYTATIVDMGLTSCGWTKFMKVKFFLI